MITSESITKLILILFVILMGFLTVNFIGSKLQNLTTQSAREISR